MVALCSKLFEGVSRSVSLIPAEATPSETDSPRLDKGNSERAEDPEQDVRSPSPQRRASLNSVLSEYQSAMSTLAMHMTFGTF